MDNSNLIWETVRFFPQILFTLEPTMTGLRATLSNDMSHFHYFLESAYGCTDVRDLDFT